MLRRRGAFALSLLPLCGVAACAGIIGDFTKGDEVPDASGVDGAPFNPTDGASSGNLPDVVTTNDGPSPQGTGDAGDAGEAGPAEAGPPSLLTCAFQVGGTVTLANFQRQSSDTPDELFFLGPTGSTQTAYIVIPGGGGFGNNQGGDVFKYPADQGSPNVIHISAPPGQIYDAHRTPDGIVLLSVDYSLPGHNQLVVWKLSEGVTDAGVPVWQRIPVGPLDPIPANTCRQIATFLVVNSATDDYIAALSYNPSPSGCSGAFDPPLLFAVRTGGAPDGGGSAPLVQWDVPQVDGGTQQLDFARDGIVRDPTSSKVYLFADPSGNGPPADVGPIVFTSPDTLPEGGATAQPTNLGNISFASGLGFVYSPNNGAIDVGFLGGDLTLNNPGLFVGQALPGNVATRPVSSYPEYVVTSVEALPVDKGRSHWHSFNGSEDLLLVGRNDIKGGNGINVFWFDEFGNLRVRQAATDGGVDHSALLQNHTIIGADITFDGPPVGSPPVLGNLLIAVTESTGVDGGVTSYSLTQYHTTCTPP
jgi:hypothetical protein